MTYLYDNINLSQIFDDTEITGVWPERPQIECFIHSCWNQAKYIRLSDNTGQVFPFCETHAVPKNTMIQIENLDLDSFGETEQ